MACNEFMLLVFILLITRSNATISMPPGCECLIGGKELSHGCQEFDCKSSSTKNTIHSNENSPQTLVEYIQYSLRSILSLQIDNSAVKGVFFKNPKISESIQNQEAGFNRFQRRAADESTETYSSSNYSPPGYVVSQPIRVAQKVNDSVIESMFGFSPPTSRIEGKCDSELVPYIVGFRDDVLSTCALLLNVTDLEELCQTSPLDWWEQENSLVGIFANADVNDTNHWLDIKKIESKSSQVWNADSKSCHGMTSSVRYVFYWTYAGSINNPQAKILHATATEVDSESIVYDADDVTQLQQFIFSSTVHWVYVKSEQDPLSLPPPKWIFAVPDDFFYPFGTSSASGKYRCAILVTTLAAFTYLYQS
jgi:hypothetical protein